MEKILFCTIPLLYRIINRLTDKVSEIKQSDKTTIMIDSGSWYIAYYMGVFHYIFTTYGVNAFDDVYFTGISAGGQTCTYCLATVHGCQNMKYWLDNGPTQLILTNNYSVGRIAFGCYNAGKFLYKKLNSKQRFAITKYFSALCMDSSFHPYICDNVDNVTDFGSAVAATGNIPIIASFRAWKFRDVYLWDGYLNNASCYVDTNKTILFTFESRGTHKREIDLSKWTKYSFVNSIFPSFCKQPYALKKTNDLFQHGYDDAKQNDDEIVYKLREIGISLSNCK